MALDFTVVFSVRQLFGDHKSDHISEEADAPFVGREKEYAFQCPDVDSSQHAILLFQSHGANVQQTLEINGQPIFGGISKGTEFFNDPNSVIVYSIAQWNGNVMLVHPWVLRESNTLRIQALEIGDSGNIDDFIIDNFVVVFKVKRAPSTHQEVLTLTG